MRFTKLHGTGNDFILLDRRAGGEPPSAAEAQVLCDRHFGVGADGVLTLLAASDGARLVIHNADGSRPEMCGNGARVAALFLATNACTEPAPQDARVRLHTAAGTRDCVVSAADPVRGDVEIAMGVPRVEPVRDLPTLSGLRPFTPVSMGNPHRVHILGSREPRSPLDLARTEGPALCVSEEANIEYARATGPQQFEIGVWERGSGSTLACGTGACAVAAAALALGLARRDAPLEITLPGGVLLIRVREDDQLLMRGPAVLVYRGEFA